MYRLRPYLKRGECETPKPIPTQTLAEQVAIFRKLVVQQSLVYAATNLNSVREPLLRFSTVIGNPFTSTSASSGTPTMRMPKTLRRLSSAAHSKKIILLITTLPRRASKPFCGRVSIDTSLINGRLNTGSNAVED